jgi:uncharacterized membrane protein
MSQAKAKPMTALVERNIAALVAQRQREQAKIGWQGRLAEAITNFAGSMPFVWLHLAVFSSWIAINVGWVPDAPRFDPTLVILAMIASVEAIFLSTFILITQNRMQAAADARAELNLQVSLLAEHEITRLVRMVSAICENKGIPIENPQQLDAFKQDVPPEEVLKTIEQHGGVKNR